MNWWFSVTFSWVLRAHIGSFCIDVNVYSSVVTSTYLLYAFSHFGLSEILIWYWKHAQKPGFLDKNNDKILWHFFFKCLRTPYYHRYIAKKCWSLPYGLSRNYSFNYSDNEAFVSRFLTHLTKTLLKHSNSRKKGFFWEKDTKTQLKFIRLGCPSNHIIFRPVFCFHPIYRCLSQIFLD